MPSNFTNPSENFIESVKQGITKEVSKGKSSVEKGSLFLKWILTKVFHATEDDAENGNLDGPNDKGIDAILEIHGSEMNFFRIFQSKFGTSHSMDDLEAFKSKMKTLQETNPNELPEGRIRDALIDIKNKGWDCEIIYITDQKVTYQNAENFHVYGINEIVQKLWNEITEPFDDKNEIISLENLLEHNKTIIGVISLSELGQLVNKSSKYIFESNIRKFLPVKTKVNKQLRKSLINEPEEVFYYNNGVTIVVKDFTLLGGAMIKLIAPQIVNGAQTSTTIADVVKGDPHIKGTIQITIIKEDVRTTRNNITKFRNSQNAVKGRDLISLEKFHKVIGSQLFTKLSYYYEQQAGAWMAKSKQEKEIFRGDETFNKYLIASNDKIIPANDAIQAMAAAIEQNPAKPYGSISKYMPGGSEYDKIFLEGKIKDDYRLLLYPYLIKSYCEKKFKYGSQKANMPEKKYARLLYVTTYFQALIDHVIDKKIDLKKEPKILDTYFENFDVNEKLLELINEVLNQFFDQTSHIRQDDDGRDIMTLHNFFASHVWSKEARTILKNIMKRKNDKFKEIKNSFLKSNL